MTSKKCSKCGEFKCIDKFYFIKSKNKYNAACKDCLNYYRRKKGLTESQRQSNIKRSREYYKNNKKELLKKQKIYSSKNKDKISKNNKRYYKDNSENIKNYRKTYYQKNKEKELLRIKEYSNRNKAKCNAIKRKYDYSKLNATPKWADIQKIETVYEKVKWLEKLTGLRYHVDHIIPLQGENVCGLHVWENLQILEASINCSKRNNYDY